MATRWAACSRRTRRGPKTPITPPISERRPPEEPRRGARRSGHARRPSHTRRRWTTPWRCSRGPGILEGQPLRRGPLGLGRGRGRARRLGPGRISQREGP
eukprot:872230-Pyramimonas_sp.AAC.1